MIKDKTNLTSKARTITISPNTLPPKFKSTTITLNDDGTYKITHTWDNVNIDNELYPVKITYPRVQMQVDSTVELHFGVIQKNMRLNPFVSFEYINVLPDRFRDYVYFRN